MRSRVTIRRNLINASSLGRRSFIDYKGNKPKALQRHRDEEGNAFYTVSKWGEGRGEPSPQSVNAKKSFLISDLLLDLDAYEVAGVRPYDSQDHERYAELFRTTGRRGEVEKSVQELAKALDQSRLSVRKVVLHPAHPKRITDGDIMSTALRPPPSLGPIYTPSKGVHPSATSGGDNEADGEVEKYDIKFLNHVHPKRQRSSAVRFGTRETVNCVRTKYDEIRRVTDFDEKARQESDFTRQVWQANGIPENATQNDEHLIRWMLLRQHNSAFIGDKNGPPEPEDIVGAIKEIQEQGGSGLENIASIRRIIFHAVNAGSNLRGSGREGNVAVQMLESIRAALEIDFREKHLAFEVWTFVNNLSLRPGVMENRDMALAVLCLRLRAAATLGYLKLMATYLDRGVDFRALTSHDVRAILSSLNVSFTQTTELQSIENRRLLFRILTGEGQNGPVEGDSLRKFALLEETKEEIGGTPKSPVYKRYTTLLERVGTFDSLWGEAAEP